MKKIIFLFSLLAFLNNHINSQVTLTIPDQTIANNATTLSVPVLIKADYPITTIGWQFFIEWDETVLTFQSISNINDPALSLQDFGTPNQTGKNNQLSFVWENYPENIALTDENQWFMLHFQINSTESNTALAFCTDCANEMYKSDLEAVQLFYQNSQITFGGNLPIELLDFKVKTIDNQQVNLDWITEKEINSSHFDVERSQDGTTWNTIGKVAVLTSTITKKSYHFIDKNPSVGVNMYRLKKVDLDMKFMYSAIKTAFISKENRVFEYQNPVDKLLDIQWTNPRSEKMKWSLYDTQGKLLKQKSQTFSEGSQQMIWNMADLASGLYFLEIVGDEMNTFKVVKQ